MPLCQTTSDTTEDGGGNEVLVGARFSANESVEESILESSKKRRGEAAGGEERMGCGFSYGTDGLLQQMSQWAGKARRGQIEGKEKGSTSYFHGL